jgi:hypothetical protein
MAALSYSLQFGPKGTPGPMPGPVVIPLARLPYFTASGSDFWTGTMRFWVPGGRNGHSHTYLYFGVRLSPAALMANLPEPPPSPSLPVTSPIIGPVPNPLTAAAPVPVLAITPKGGRPPKAYWQRLWIEMARQLYEGDLKPERQADIEKAMTDWLAAQGEHPSERTIRDAARDLWQAVKGKN